MALQGQNIASAPVQISERIDSEQVRVIVDEVRMGPPRVHVEENASDQPADAIAVELK